MWLQLLLTEFGYDDVSSNHEYLNVVLRKQTFWPMSRNHRSGNELALPRPTETSCGT